MYYAATRSSRQDQLLLVTSPVRVAPEEVAGTDDASRDADEEQDVSERHSSHRGSGWCR